MSIVLHSCRTLISDWSGSEKQGMGRGRGGTPSSDPEVGLTHGAGGWGGVGVLLYKRERKVSVFLTTIIFRKL